MRMTLNEWVDAARRGWKPSKAEQSTLTDGPSILPAHVGLWLDRALIEPDEASSEGRPGRDALYDVAIRALAPAQKSPALACYAPRFEAFHRAVNPCAPTPGVQRWCFVLEATTRVLLHAATGSTVTEGGVLLHHTYGVPYLPGSTLKGVLRAAAEDAAIHPEGCDAGQKASGVREIFGDVKEGEHESASGLFDFWDALWIPELPKGAGVQWSPLALDIVNPHYSTYYESKSEDPPDGCEDPVPSHHLTIRPGTRFLGAVEAASDAGAQLAPWAEWLKTSLKHAADLAGGAGARRRAGYGRLRLVQWWPAELPISASSQTRKRAQAFVQYHPGDGRIVATIDGGGTALATQPASKALLEQVPESFRKRLRGGTRAVVEWVEDGNRRTLVSIAKA